jgi:capsular polysaccharide biosynthesis protein
MADVAHPTNQLYEFLTLFRTKKWWIILPGLAGVAVALVALCFIPKRYQSWSKVEVGEVRFEEDFQFRNTLLNPYKDLQNVAARILSTNALIKVISETLQWGDYLAIATNPEKRKTFLEEVVDRTKVERARKDKDQGNDYITITYKDEDPKRAAAFVIAIRDYWMNDTRQSFQDRIQGELTEDQRQLDRLSTQLDNIRSKIKVWQEQYKLSPTLPSDRRTPTEDDWVIREYRDARAELIRQESELKGAEQRYQKAAKRQLDEPLYIEVEVDKTAGNAAAVDSGPSKLMLDKLTEWRQKKADAETKLVGIKPLNKQYKLLKTEIAAADAEIKNLEGQLKKAGVATTPVESDKPVTRTVLNPEKLLRKQEADRAEEELETRRALFKQQEQRTAALEEQQKKRPQIYTTYQTLETSKDVVEKQYKESSDKVEVKKKILQRIQSVAGNPYRILDDAVPAESPTEPNAIIIIAIGLVGGAGLGLGWIFVREFVRASFRSVEDAAGSLSLPVLGVVNRMVTTREVRRRRLRSVLGVSASLAAILVVSTFAGLYLVQPKLLPSQMVYMIENVKQKFK